MGGASKISVCFSAMYLSATTDRQGSGVYIIFSSTDQPKILIACKCSTFWRYFLESCVCIHISCIVKAEKREKN